jgi:hypothetical protein
MRRSSSDSRDAGGRLKEGTDKALIEDAAWLVLDGPPLMEGVGVEHLSAFGARLRRVMAKALW